MKYKVGDMFLDRKTGNEYKIKAIKKNSETLEKSYIVELIKYLPFKEEDLDKMHYYPNDIAFYYGVDGDSIIQDEGEEPIKVSSEELNNYLKGDK
jgi:hypothetical protein